ncbi:MAG TPA: rhodanese-like domain-containing protein [Bryobacteraceae bacterium]|nr:rhodanese-like domain-containing protein [Bryobacteraceae bacterium]
MKPADLADRLRRSDETIHVICVAFPVLYRQRHIAGAILAGPTSKPEGLTALNSALESLKKTDLVVLYCGCCPMERCPNIRPAYLTTKKLEFKNVRVLNLATNFHTDWTAKGYSVAEG